MEIGSRLRREIWVSIVLRCLIIFCSLHGIFSTSVVTLKSIQIFKSHDWLTAEPAIYFRCNGENKTFLPDVKKTYFLYTFKGAESWQPLTELKDEKCKRCGLYEKDKIKSDDVFDEWELCPDDFVPPEGKYLRLKEKEFNITLSCRQCLPIEPGSVQTARSKHVGDRGFHSFLVILISALVSVVSVIAFVSAYKYWQRKKRQHEQARFLKLFEDDDDIEDELGLGQII